MGARYEAANYSVDCVMTNSKQLETLIETACRQFDEDPCEYDPIDKLDLPGTLARGERLPLYEVDNGKQGKSEVKSICQAVTIGTTRIYLHVEEYPDEKPGGLQIALSKTGDSLRVYDVLADTASKALQYGMPLESLIESWEYVQMEPRGVTTDPKIPMASSICDYIAKWFKKKYFE